MKKQGAMIKWLFFYEQRDRSAPSALVAFVSCALATLCVIAGFAAVQSGIWSRKRVGYLLGLVFLVTAVVVFAFAQVWSGQAAAEATQQVLGSHFSDYPPFFTYGTSPGCTVLLMLIFFVNAVWELALLFVSILQQNRRGDDLQLNQTI